MAEVELTKMSSRGQIVIPLEIREEMHLREGTAFAVTGKGDTLLLKMVKTPSKEEILAGWERITAKAREQAKKHGIKQSDVEKIIHGARGIKG